MPYAAAPCKDNANTSNDEAIVAHPINQGD